MLPPGKRLPTVVISNLSPLVEGGRYPTKRVVGEKLRVEADIFKEGHDQPLAVLSWRRPGSASWTEMPMHHVDNDRWAVELSFDQTGHYELAITAWADDFLSWLHDFERRLHGGQTDLNTEIEEGRVILGQAAIRAATGRSSADAEVIEMLTTRLMQTEPAEVPHLMDLDEVKALLARWPNRSLATTSEQVMPLVVEIKQSLFSAWYEFFPRSAEGLINKHSTFRDCLPRLEDAAAMGFDVVYFPPIHPIGMSHRKGKNNAVSCEPGDVGSPWAIGGEAGGHRTVEPALGTIEDSSGSSARPAPAASRSRSTSPSTARPTIPTCASIPSGSTSGPTAASATPRIRRRSTRTSTPSISTATTGASCGRAASTWCSSG
jgi:starch synthase (maltosyl-transferring)